EEIEQNRVRIEELEEQNANIQGDSDAKAERIATLERENEEHLKELSSLRDRTNISQRNWLKEKEELLEQSEYLRNEFEEAKQAMHSWEILAMEERSIRENLNEKVMDLEEQLGATRMEYEKAAAECATQSVTVDGLQKALEEIQKARKLELRELAENSDAQIEQLKKKVEETDKRASEATSRLETAEAELQRALVYEKEVKEKNLLIGKLRHEAVTLNEHLTKALKSLKKGRVEDNVDRHLVTNYLLQFLSLERADPKKFQVLQLISALLGWSDEEKEQAGLARPGSTTHHTPGFGSLRSPSSPMFRGGSTPSMPTDYLSAESSSVGSRKESLAELWSDFLEQEQHSNARDSRKSTDSRSPPAA
ncbi:hypothetical protein KEM55_007263, partial [Ascosphaera atra]